MRTLIAGVAGALVLVVFTWGVVSQERVLRESIKSRCRRVPFVAVAAQPIRTDRVHADHDHVGLGLAGCLSTADTGGGEEQGQQSGLGRLIHGDQNL